VPITDGDLAAQGAKAPPQNTSAHRQVRSTATARAVDRRDREEWRTPAGGTAAGMTDNHRYRRQGPCRTGKPGRGPTDSGRLKHLFTTAAMVRAPVESAGGGSMGGRCLDRRDSGGFLRCSHTDSGPVMPAGTVCQGACSQFGISR